MDAELVKALLEAATWVQSTFGAWVFYATAGLWLAWLVYREWKKSHEADLLIEEKERTIQRLNEDNRWMRGVLLVKLGLSVDEVGNLMLPPKPAATPPSHPPHRPEPIKVKRRGTMH